mgnify:CR=1 FL=1
MKIKKFSKEWFGNKLKQYENMLDGRGKRLNLTKGWKPDLRGKSKKEQRIESLYKLAKEKSVKF